MAIHISISSTVYQRAVHPETMKQALCLLLYRRLVSLRRLLDFDLCKHLSQV
jgi:hypothetical protein